MRDLSEKYFPVIENYIASKLSVQAFCAQHDIKAGILNYWKKKYHAQKTSLSPAKGFTSLVVESSRSFASIHYPDGTRIVFENRLEAALLKQFLPVFQP